jgi:hypothetical protein
LILLGPTILCGGYPFDFGIVAAIYCGFILRGVTHFWVSSIYLILQLKLSFNHIAGYLAGSRGLGSWELSFFPALGDDAFEIAAVNEC